MNKEIKLNRLKFALTPQMFDMTVDGSAAYDTNAREFYQKAVIGQDSVRSMFRQFTGIKDRVKVGLAEFDSLIMAGDCEPDFSNSTISQKTFEVCPLMYATNFCVDSLENSFVSDELKAGSNNWSEPQPFMNYFYEVLGNKAAEELAILSFQGQVNNPAFTGTSAYLATCDGLEYQLSASTTVLKPATASTVNSNNVILKLIEARDAVPTAVRKKSDFVYIVSTNVWDALADAVSENKSSGLYYIEAEDLKFQGTRIIRADEASDNVIIAGALSNFVNVTDLDADSKGWNVVDFMKTTLSRKIGIRSDFKLKVSFLVDEEIYFHRP